jgi:histone H3/H4
MREVLAPALRQALDAHCPLDLIEVRRQALLQGDEAHRRTVAVEDAMLAASARAEAPRVAVPA